MGCDIHSVAEYYDASAKKWRGKTIFLKSPYDEGSWRIRGPFEYRNYGVFGFLANVRNYSGVPPLSEPRGLPSDISGTADDLVAYWNIDGHSHSWLTVEELTKFNYDAIVEDLRVTRELAPGFFNGGCTAEEGEGVTMTWREFLGPLFFEDLEELQKEGIQRIVFWFDN